MQKIPREGKKKRLGVLNVYKTEQHTKRVKYVEWGEKKNKFNTQNRKNK